MGEGAWGGEGGEAVGRGELSEGQGLTAYCLVTDDRERLRTSLLFQTKRISHSERSEGSRAGRTLSVKSKQHFRFFAALRMTNPLGLSLSTSAVSRADDSGRGQEAGGGGEGAGGRRRGAGEKGGLALNVHLLALAGYAALTVLMTWPLPSELGTEVIGGGDAWQNIWNLWWVRESLLGAGGPQNPYFTDLLYYPDGVGLYLHTLAFTAGLMGIPLQLVGFDLVTTYNIVLLLTSVLGGYGAFLLCHYVTGSRWGSFVGGVVFAFSPYHSAHLYGHMNLASLQWIPFYGLALLKAIDARGGSGQWTVDSGQKVEEVGRTDSSSGIRHRLVAARYSALVGVLLAVNAYTDWVYAVFLALLTGLILAWKVVVPGERRRLAARGVGWGEGGLRLAVGGGVALLLVSPVLFPTLVEAGKGYAQQPPRETLVYSSDLTLAFTPSELHPLWGKRVRAHLDGMGPYTPLKHPSERTVFLGYTVLGLAGYGVWRRRRELRAWMWAAVAAVTWVLSLGPVLQVLGKSSFTAFGVEVPLPYLLLYKLPLFSIMRTPARLVVLTMLALGVLVAFALRTKGDKGSGVGGRGSEVMSDDQAPGTSRQLPLSSVVRRMSSVVLPVLIVFEFWAAPFETVPPGWNVPIYREIRGEPGRFGVLELPLRTFSDYMAYQTVHGKPLVGGYLSRQPPYPTVEETPALRYLLDDTPPDSALRGLVAGGKGVEALREMEVKYVIIRWWAFTEEQKVGMRAKLDALLGRPPDVSYPEHQVDVWKLY